MKSLRTFAALLTLSTMACIPACRCSSSDPGPSASETAKPQVSAPSTPPASVSIDPTAVRRITMRPGGRPMLLNPSAIHPPSVAPSAQP